MGTRHIARSAAAVIGTAAFTLGLATTAQADRPFEFEEPVTFVDTNPCTGAAHEVSIVFGIALHAHRNNEVLVVDSIATTDEGHEGRGHEAQVITRNGVLRTNHNFMLRNAGGQQYAVHGRLVIDLDSGDLLAGSFRLQCVRPG